MEFLGVDCSRMGILYVKRVAGWCAPDCTAKSVHLRSGGGRFRLISGLNLASMVTGYTGYWIELDGNTMKYFRNPQATFTIPGNSYFAPSDNSTNSLDSRFWEPVSAKNIEGRAAFVYWLFRHFDLVR